MPPCAPFASSPSPMRSPPLPMPSAPPSPSARPPQSPHLCPRRTPRGTHISVRGMMWAELHRRLRLRVLQMLVITAGVTKLMFCKSRSGLCCYLCSAENRSCGRMMTKQQTQKKRGTAARTDCSGGGGGGSGVCPCTIVRYEHEGFVRSHLRVEVPLVFGLTQGTASRCRRRHRRRMCLHCWAPEPATKDMPGRQVRQG